ncbi:hypothetical protein BDR04DRAFT_1145689 [Suillus decipiens]|nr:hypothetical protein BDR04DRAFT_1145689 [Suillus decipiens]
MPVSTTELIIFDTTEAVRNDRSNLKPAFNLVSKSNSIQILARHQEMSVSPSYATLIEALKPAYGGWSKMHQVIFNAHRIAFQQHVTKVLLLAIKNPSNRTEVFNTLTKISDSTKKLLVFCPTLEDNSVIIVVSGWHSVEMVANPEPKAALEQLYALTNKDRLFHSKLDPFQGPEHSRFGDLELSKPSSIFKGNQLSEQLLSVFMNVQSAECIEYYEWEKGRRRTCYRMTLNAFADEWTPASTVCNVPSSPEVMPFHSDLTFGKPSHQVQDFKFTRIR